MGGTERDSYVKVWYTSDPLPLFAIHQVFDGKDTKGKRVSECGDRAAFFARVCVRVCAPKIHRTKARTCALASTPEVPSQLLNIFFDRKGWLVAIALIVFFRENIFPRLS